MISQDPESRSHSGRNEVRENRGPALGKKVASGLLGGEGARSTAAGWWATLSDGCTERQAICGGVPPVAGGGSAAPCQGLDRR